MNSGIVISFVVGGLLLISLITLNSQVIENSGEAVLNMSAKETVSTVTQVMTRDFLRIGYNTGNDPKDAIQSISAKKIVFMADLNDVDTSSPVEITWEAHPNQGVTSTNDNLYKLTRTVDSGPEQGTTTFAVTDFDFTYLNSEGNTPANASAVKSIQVALQTEAGAKYSNQNYQRSVWSKTFTPPNLNLGSFNKGSN